MLTSFFTVKPAVASAPKKAVKKIAPPSPAPPSPSPSPAVDAASLNDDEVSVGDSLDGGGEVLETPVSDCADKDFPDTLSDISDADDLAAAAAAAADIDDDDIFTLLRTQSRRSIDRMSGPELCCDDEDF